MKKKYRAFAYRFLQFDKPQKLATLEASRVWLGCEKCPDLVKTRSRVVFGSGNPYAKLFFLGEAPGPQEDQDGVGFVGRSGDLLNAFLKVGGLSRSAVWVDNAVQCQPVKEADGRSTNRPPTNLELANCRHRLWETIRLVDPWLIVALGGSAAKTLTLDNQISVTKARGDLVMVRVPGVYKMIDYPMVIMQHPSYVLRDETETVYSRKWWFKEDFKLLLKTIRLAEKCYGSGQ